MKCCALWRGISTGIRIGQPDPNPFDRLRSHIQKGLARGNESHPLGPGGREDMAGDIVHILVDVTAHRKLAEGNLEVLIFGHKL